MFKYTQNWENVAIFEQKILDVRGTSFQGKRSILEQWSVQITYCESLFDAQKNVYHRERSMEEELDRTGATNRP